MPARVRDILRAFKNLGGEVEKPQPGIALEVPDERPDVPVPAHNGAKTEVSD